MWIEIGLVWRVSVDCCLCLYKNQVDVADQFGYIREQVNVAS